MIKSITSLIIIILFTMFFRISTIHCSSMLPPPPPPPERSQDNAYFICSDAYSSPSITEMYEVQLCDGNRKIILIVVDQTPKSTMQKARQYREQLRRGQNDAGISITIEGPFPAE